MFRYRLILASALVLATMTAVTVRSVGTSSATVGQRYYVSPSGNNSMTGTSSAPFATIQHALDVAQPGTTIVLDPGVYRGSVHTVRDGTPSAPISIVGSDPASGPHDTVLYGKGHVFDVNNSWYDIRGFEIDGQQALEAAAPYPSDPSSVTNFKNQHQDVIENDRLLYIGGKAAGVTGVTVDNMLVQGAGGECIRVRDDATQIAVNGSVIQYCGLDAKRAVPGDPYHNGEGIYIGTSPTSTSESNYADDTTNSVKVTNDEIRTYGSECVDIKENAHDNLIRGNLCADNLEPSVHSGSNLEIRGYGNAVVDNTVTWSLGSNVKLAVDASGYPQSGNLVEYNVLGSAGVGAAAGLSVDDQVTGATICGNVLGGMTTGVSVVMASGPCTSTPATTSTSTTEVVVPTTTTPPVAPTTTEPSASPPSTMGPPTTSSAPGQILDLSNWKVTLPIDSTGLTDGTDAAIEVDQPALATFSDPYFRPDAAGDGVTFVAPIDGATTSGSYYPRSELREMSGAQPASWSTTTGTNEMDLTESVDSVPTVKQQVVFAQIHGSSDDVFEAETRYSSTLGFVLYVNHNGVQWGSDLVDHYVLGTPFTLTVVAAGGTIDVTYNGVLKVQEAQSSSGDYFKAGAYTQSNECTEAGLSSDCTSGKVDDNAAGAVTIYRIGVSHTA